MDANRNLVARCHQSLTPSNCFSGASQLGKRILALTAFLCKSEVLLIENVPEPACKTQVKLNR